MSLITDFLQKIAEFFSSLWDFIISIFEDTAYVVQTITGFVAKIPNLFAWLPASILTIIITVFGVVAVYKVLGRD